MTAETLPMIGRLLGHATVRYAYLDDANLSAAILKLGDVMEKMTV